jgi:hypothetical protein
MARADIEAELEKRKAQLKARRGKSGWAQNVRELEDRIAVLEAMLAEAE